VFAGYDRKISSLPSQPTFNNSVEAPFIYRVQLSYIRDKDIIKEQTGTEKNPVENEHNHGGGCCGGGTKDMLLHLVLMIIAFLIISYFLKR